MLVNVTTTHLELRAPAQHRPKRDTRRGFEVRLVERPDPELNHFFFVDVGRPYRWYSRLAWSYEDWRRWVERPEVTTGVGYLDRAPFGYFELEQQRDGADVEIVFFGVLPSFVGLGLGGPFLSAAIDAAWERATKRVWVHTCTEDHPAALANYLARGFAVFLEESREEEIPDPDDPVWSTPDYYASLQRYCTQK